MLKCSYSNLFKGKYDNSWTLFIKLIFVLEELVFVASDTVYKDGKESRVALYELIVRSSFQHF